MSPYWQTIQQPQVDTGLDQLRRIDFILIPERSELTDHQSASAEAHAGHRERLSRTWLREKDARFYRVLLHLDLFRIWVLTRVWGLRGTELGRIRHMPCISYEADLPRLEATGACGADMASRAATVGHGDRQAVPPDQKKTPKRRWKLTDAAKWLGISDSHLRRLAREGDVPGGETTATQRRSFSLAEMNEIRRCLDREPYRDTTTDACFRLAISNFKGGANKTTIASHLAQYFALLGYRVLLIDLDPQGSATALFHPSAHADIGQQETVLPYLVGQADTLAAVVVETAWDNIALIPACLALYAAEFQLPSMNAQIQGFRFWERLREGLSTVEDRSDIVIMDTPPALSYLTLNAVWAADGLLIPTQASMIDVQALGSYFEGMFASLRSIEQASGTEKDFAFLRIVISNYRGGSIPEQTTAGWIRKMFGEYAMDAVVLNSAAVQTAMAQMRTIYEIDPADAGDKTYRRFLESFSSVGDELLRLIHAAWPSRQPVREEAVHG